MVHEPRATPRSRSRPGASDPSVKVTSYVRKGERALLVLANFGTTPARVRLGVVISGGGGKLAHERYSSCKRSSKSDFKYE